MNTSKPALHLIPRAFLLEVAKAMKSDKQGRTDWDWLNPSTSISDQLRGALSHITKFLDREDTDPETGASHLGHAGARLAIALTLLDRSLGVDDRMPNIGRPQRLTVIEGEDAEREAHIDWNKGTAPPAEGVRFERRLGDYCPSPVKCAKCLGADATCAANLCGECAKSTTLHPEEGTVLRAPRVQVVPSEGVQPLEVRRGPHCLRCMTGEVRTNSGSLCDSCTRDDLSTTVGHGAG